MPAQDSALTIEDVVSLSKAGMSDDVIISKVKRNGKPFDLNVDEIGALKSIGISEKVIKYLMDPSEPYSAAPPPAPPAPAAAPPAPVVKAAPPSDPRILKLPPEPGIYYVKNKDVKTADDFAAIELKAVVPLKQPGKMASLSGGLVDGHIIGALVGGEAKTRVNKWPAEFFFRLGEKGTIDDLALLGLDTSNKRRDLDFGKKAGKPVFPLSAVKQFDSKEIVPGIYRITVATLKPDEYLFFILGSGDEKKGQLGKGYDFGVDKPPKPAK